MIKQIHLIECDSTQDILKEQLSLVTSEESILISCENQINGRGRGENKWSAMPGTLCFSLNIKPHSVMSFTALELSVLVSRYFEIQNINLKLKWPNDLWDSEYKKCGGILIQGINNHMCAGIGLNILSDDSELGGIFNHKENFSKKSLALNISEFILQNRYPDARSLQKDWIARCGHLNQMVTITEGGERSEGIFQGLGDYGEAKVCINGQTMRFFNGSLRLSN